MFHKKHLSKKQKKQQPLSKFNKLIKRDMVFLLDKKAHANIYVLFILQKWYQNTLHEQNKGFGSGSDVLVPGSGS